MSRYARRVDGNQLRLVRIAEQYGATTFDTSSVGRGFVDYVIGYRGRTLLVEFKIPEVEGHAHEYTEAQKLFHETWRGGEVLTIYTEAQMHALLKSVEVDNGAYRRKVIG